MRLPRSVLLCLALAAAPAPAADRARGLDGLASFTDGVVAHEIATREVAGAVVTVVDGGRVVLSRGYGYADLAANRPVDPQATLFRPGSVSKLFTWVALMQQVEAGRVRLDADVNTYIDFRIPDYRGQPIRVRDLLSHSPGMSDISDFIFYDAKEVTPYAQWMKAHVPRRLWAPGTEIAYSNYGAMLAGYIVERVAGEPYADYAERHIFAPLRMTSTTFREPLPPPLGPRMATGYRAEDGTLVAKAPERLSTVMPAGSATTSAPDMARFMMALLDGGALDGARILRRETLATMEGDLLANVPGLPGLAHGFLVEREAGPRLIGHAGNTIDFHSDLVIAPTLGTGFFLSFTGGKGSSLARTELRDALIGRLFPQSPRPRWTGGPGLAKAGGFRVNRRDYEGPADPDELVRVAIAGPHRVTVTSAGVTTSWDQVGPDEYEKATGARDGGPYDRLKFYGAAGDLRLSFASLPYETFHFVPLR